MEAIIRVLEAVIALRDPYTVGHQQRTTRLACLIAAEMDLPETSLEDLWMAGRLHDLGKIAVPGEILSKSGKLTEAEFSLIKCHPQVGYEILQSLNLNQGISQIILQHHERLDGSGYPRGLKGAEILLEARILAVADVVEAISSFRPYRPSLGQDQALAEIDNFKTTLYDAAVVDACNRVFEYEQRCRSLEWPRLSLGTPDVDIYWMSDDCRYSQTDETSLASVPHLLAGLYAKRGEFRPAD
jgi:HD-GYP domain-containing protein (c-di-GMP phosphodiesterase class II)